MRNFSPALLGLFAVFLIAVSAKANTASVGSERSPDNAIKASTTIGIGILEESGNAATSDTPGADYFNNAKITLHDTLKGSLIGKVTVNYSLKTGKESAPLVKTPYIIFLTSSNSAQNRIIKLLPATADDIAKVKAKLSSGRLVGSSVYIDDAIREATVIGIGTFRALGSGPGLGVPGEWSFENAKLGIQSFLDGKLPADTALSYTVKCDFYSESAPSMNTQYIVFIKKDNILKMLPATEKNLNVIRKKLGPRSSPFKG
ncbi:MAG: hypothetical protein ABIP97_01150 [Chthoniobacterales bacterium]